MSDISFRAKIISTRKCENRFIINEGRKIIFDTYNKELNRSSFWKIKLLRFIIFYLKLRIAKKNKSTSES
jgi:hypothetical protein